MPRTAVPAAYAFNGGEISKKALGRVDVAKMRLSAQCQVNWLPHVVGPAMLRPGLLYIGDVLNDNPEKLLPFIYAKDDTTLIELTANTARFWINETLLARPSVTTFIFDPTFTGSIFAASALAATSSPSGTSTIHVTVSSALAGVNVNDTSRAAIPAGSNVVTVASNFITITNNTTTAILANDVITFGGWVTTDSTAGNSAILSNPDLALTCPAIGGIARAKQVIVVPSGSQNTEHGIRVVVGNGPVTLRAGSTDGNTDYINNPVLDTGTHSLVCTPTGGFIYLQIESDDAWGKTVDSVSIEAAGTVTLPTPWASADLPNVRWDQSGDELYIACYGQQQQLIQRRGVRPGARGWSVVTYRVDDGPFHAGADVGNLFLTPAALSGNTTITSNLPFFTGGHVGALLRLFSPGQNCAAEIGAASAYTLPVQVSGIGNDRTLAVSISGSWTGAWCLERSLIGPDDGFVILTSADPGFNSTANFGANGTYNYNDNGWTSSTTVDLTHAHNADWDNVDAWYRLGFGPNATFTGSISTEEVIASNVTGILSIGQILSNGGVTAGTTITYNYAGGGAGIYFVSTSQSVSTTAITATNYGSGFATMALSTGVGGWYGIGRILAVLSPTEVDVEILSPFSSLNPTSLWQISDWCSAFGWPTSVAFHEGRLGWFSGGEIPMSLGVSNDYTSYAEADLYGNSLGDSGAILESFGSGPMDTVSWGLSLTRLLLGREQSISSARSSNFDQAMTPTDFVVRDCSDQGAERLPAVKLGKRAVYVQQSGRKVYELAFNAAEFDYDDRDLTRLNSDIGLPGYVAIAAARQPDHMVHLPRGDGQSAALLYNVKDEVEAWWRIMTLGAIQDVCVLPGDGQGLSGENLEDLVYFVVQRNINGSPKRFIERLARRDQCVGGSFNYLFDSAFIYSNTATSALTISWLPSTSIGVWADSVYIGSTSTNGSGTFTMPDLAAHSNVVAGLTGAVIIGSTNNPLSNNVAPAQVFANPTGTLTVGTQYNGYPAEVFADIGATGRPVQHIGSLVVSGGAVTLPNGQIASTIVACLGFVAPYMSAKLAYAASGPTALTQKKRIDHVGLVLFDTAAVAGNSGLMAGQDFSVLDEMPLVESDQTTSGLSTGAGTIWSEYDGPVMEVPGSWDVDARLCLLAQAPNPCTVGAAVVVMQTSDIAPQEHGG